MDVQLQNTFLGCTPNCCWSKKKINKKNTKPHNCLLYHFIGDKLVPEARDVLIEIFKSCVHAEQMLSLTPAKFIKVSDIYLSKEQMNSQTPGNLLHTFFTNVRPPKKLLEDQLTQVIVSSSKIVPFLFVYTWPGFRFELDVLLPTCPIKIWSVIY